MKSLKNYVSEKLIINNSIVAAVNSIDKLCEKYNLSTNRENGVRFTINKINLTRVKLLIMWSIEDCGLDNVKIPNDVIERTSYKLKSIASVVRDDMWKFQYSPLMAAPRVDWNTRNLCEEIINNDIEREVIWKHSSNFEIFFIESKKYFILHMGMMKSKKNDNGSGDIYIGYKK